LLTGYYTTTHKPRWAFNFSHPRPPPRTPLSHRQAAVASILYLYGVKGIERSMSRSRSSMRQIQWRKFKYERIPKSTRAHCSAFVKTESMCLPRHHVCVSRWRALISECQIHFLYFNQGEDLRFGDANLRCDNQDYLRCDNQDLVASLISTTPPIPFILMCRYRPIIITSSLPSNQSLNLPDLCAVCVPHCRCPLLIITCLPATTPSP
jgi:hypothetical protein